jgi:hypothetical protein
LAGIEPAAPGGCAPAALHPLADLRAGVFN